MLSLVPERTLADAVSMADTLDAAGVESLISKHESGLHAILAPSEPRTAESVSADLVAKLFPLLTELYDIVLIDTPPAFTEHVLAAMDVSDQIVLITTPEVPSIKNLKLTLQTLDLLGFPADRRKIVLNRADIHLGLSGADVSSMIDTSVQLEVPADRAVPLSINQGVPLVAEKPKHPASRALHALATMLWREEQTISIPEQARHRSGRRGWRRQKELAR
jgi:pilus assembly protein CpaE